MKIKLFLSLVLVCVISAPAQMRLDKQPVRQPRQTTPKVEPNAVSQLPIRRVILYSNGVAYVERRGFVAGDAEINLSFKQSQIDDVLKSMVVLDLNKGKIGAVSYNSSAPASARTAEIPFAVDATSGDQGGGISEVLAQLQGAKVFVSSPKGAAAGSINTSTNQPDPDSRS